MVTPAGPPSRRSSRAARRIALLAFALRGRPRGRGASCGFRERLTWRIIYVTERNVTLNECQPRRRIHEDGETHSRRKAGVDPLSHRAQRGEGDRVLRERL